MNMFARSFNAFIQATQQEFLTAPVVEGAKWQSTQAPQPMVEILNKSVTFDLRGFEDLDIFREGVQPNLPWADNHFEQERVSGEPINPGETWKQWPFARSAAAHLRDGENIAQYDHSYAERYWPKFAGTTPDGRLPEIKATSYEAKERQLMSDLCFVPPVGIRFPVGDLDDLIQVLCEDPLTRQAYLPIFFPEDIAAARMSKRVPCTLGYHFICRQNALHVVYPMRSCDFVRHFRDDVYLTIRLLLWVLDRLKTEDPETWDNVYPGTLRMHMTSLHMFMQDRVNLVNMLRNRSPG
jgi:hypothetical protein